MTIKCPACNLELNKLSVNNYTVDACSNGCGGVWFDKDEIWSLDEKSEYPEHEILKLAKDKESMKVDHGKVKNCPHCREQILARQFFDTKNEVEIDLCWSCGGLWLDPGEINKIRLQYETHSQRAAAADQYINDIISETNTKLNAEAKTKLEEYNKRYANRLSSFLGFFKALISRNHPGDIDNI